MAYRADIDGLRAIAVLLVILFHIDALWVPGGFVGVDVFFVISGFVIAGNILRDVDHGRFSFAEFYRRRIRRIFPMMFLVTGVTLGVGVMLLLPEDAVELSWSAVATMLSAANVYFLMFLDTSYFAPDSATVPLLHMWSLGVEEQFYFIWPALLLLLIKFRFVLMLATLVIASAFSVWIGEVLLAADEFAWAFYMLPSRVFQFASGSTAALILRQMKGRPIPARAATVLCGLGLASIAISGWMLDEETPFPGLHALPVTLGAALLCLAGRFPNVVATALSVEPLRRIGAISYSLYLWHWPVLSYQRYFDPDLSLAQKVFSFVVIVALSALTYRYVEQRFRRTTEPFGRVLLKQFLVPLTSLTAVALALVASEGFGPYRWTAYPERLALAKSVRTASSTGTVCQRSQLRDRDLSPARCVEGSGTPSVLLYGDSHAAHYIGVATALARRFGFTLRNYEHSSCPPILGDPTAFVSPKKLNKCEASLKVVREDLARYRVLLVGAAWSSYVTDDGSFEAAVRDFVLTATTRGTRVVLFAQVPPTNFDADCERKNAKMTIVDCAAAGVRTHDDEAFNDVLRDIARENPLVRVVEPARLMCEEGICRAYKNGLPLYYDDQHLNFDGSWLLGQEFAASAEGEAIGRFIAGSSN